MKVSAKRRMRRWALQALDQTLGKVTPMPSLIARPLRFSVSTKKGAMDPEIGVLLDRSVASQPLPIGATTLGDF